MYIENNMNIENNMKNNMKNYILNKKYNIYKIYNNNKIKCILKII